MYPNTSMKLTPWDPSPIPTSIRLGLPIPLHPFTLSGYPKIPIWLVVLTILKNMKVNGKEYPIYEMEHKIHVPNHQAVICIYIYAL